MRKIALTGAGLVFAAVLAIPGVAFAHHVYLDFTANGASVPNGDPNGTASGTIDFNDEVNNQLCLNATAQNLSTITHVQVVKLSDASVLVDFGTSLVTCITATTEQLDALHDFADEYRFLITTTEYPEGAVAGLFTERPPSTTTSSSTPSSSTSSSTSTTVTTTQAVQAVSVTPRFTG
jgi:hypothetical protein